MKRKNNTLTIGLVTYNGEKTLQNSLESLRKQTYKDFKLIISDNNSNACERGTPLFSITAICLKNTSKSF